MSCECHTDNSQIPMSTEPITGPDLVRKKFPHLQPLKSMPSLTTMNGIGLGLYGKRDFDEETQTYVKTRFFCFVFIPLFALDAYRVADAGSRTWYFFGKEKLSAFTRNWNLTLAALIVCLGLAGGWHAHTSSPEYRARRDMKLAAEYLKSGDTLKAAGVYRQHLSDSVAAEARIGLKQALETSLQSDKVQSIVGAFRLLDALPATVNKPEPLIPDAFNRGFSLAQKFRGADPENALEILNAAAALDATNSSAATLRIDLLKQILAVHPANTNRAVELAVAYEAAGQLDESCNVLRPFRSGLGSSEGARILGQRLLSEQDYAGAYHLLHPYVEARLGKMRMAESAYTNIVASVSRRILDDLNNNRGPRSFYDAYEKGSKEEKEKLVDDYMEAEMRNDPSLLRALASLKSANQIVPVVLDLGIVQLNRAQNLQDATQRKAELEAAEKTFLAIKGAAGETDEYRLFLGQVYYWLGRSQEGKELFDQLLASRKRAFPMLMSLASTLRSVGEVSEARALAEEAYRTGKTDDEKFNAASFRALVFTDDDDQIAWLEKSDQGASWIQIELNAARGKRALQKGNKTLAESFLRKAIAGYDNHPRTAVTLNNCSLAWFSVYEITGNLEDHRRGMAMLEEAVALDPKNSILLHNTMYYLISRAVMEVTQDSILSEALGRYAEIKLLSHLYANEAERSRIIQQLQANATMKKGLAYLDKSLLLSPKNIGLYEIARSVYVNFRDVNELKKLQQRFQIAAPDLTEVRHDVLEAYSGSKDKEYLESLQTRIKEQEGLAQKPTISQHLLTSELVNTTLIHLRQGAWAYGGEVDSRKDLQLALELNEKHSSTATRQALKSVYFFRAMEELAAQNADVAAMQKQTRRGLSAGYLVTAILERGGPLAELARKNENVVRIFALEKASVQDFPGSCHIAQWALLRTSDPELAAQLAKKINEDEVGRLSDQLEFQFNPLSSSSVLEQYWTLRMHGDEAGALKIYQAAQRDGVPLPPL
jgi:hypothetical protein